MRAMHIFMLFNSATVYVPVLDGVSIVSVFRNFNISIFRSILAKAGGQSLTAIDRNSAVSRAVSLTHRKEIRDDVQEQIQRRVRVFEFLAHEPEIAESVNVRGAVSDADYLESESSGDETD